MVDNSGQILTRGLTLTPPRPWQALAHKQFMRSLSIFHMTEMDVSCRESKSMERRTLTWCMRERDHKKNGFNGNGVESEGDGFDGRRPGQAIQ